MLSTLGKCVTAPILLVGIALLEILERVSVSVYLKDTLLNGMKNMGFSCFSLHLESYLFGRKRNKQIFVWWFTPQMPRQPGLGQLPLMPPRLYISRELDLGQEPAPKPTAVWAAGVSVVASPQHLIQNLRLERINSWQITTTEERKA